MALALKSQFALRVTEERSLTSRSMYRYFMFFFSFIVLDASTYESGEVCSSRRFWSLIREVYAWSGVP